MPKSTAVCNSILALIFNATAWADIAENDGSAPLSSLWIGLHTANPGVGGDQRTNEATYGSYARLEVVRTTSGWEIPASGETSNEAILQFVEATGVTVNEIQWISIGKAGGTVAGQVLYAGELSSYRSISAGIQPQFNANALIVRET